VIVGSRTTYVPHASNRYDVRYSTPRAYSTHIERRYIFRQWIQEPVIFSYTNGYWEIDNYPYYVESGFRYRYSPVETCQYDLVDSSSYDTVRSYPIMACNIAFDTCSADREVLNGAVNAESYFCAEHVDDDLGSNSDDEYDDSPVVLTDAQKAQIDDFLENLDDKKLYDKGVKGVGACSIAKPAAELNSTCKYVVKVEEQIYPDINGTVCSEEDSAEQIGCNNGDEKSNASCILRKAIQEGYCL
jgi:hypothetical protein